MLVDKPLTVEEILSSGDEKEKVKYIIETITSLTEANQRGSVTIAINGDWGSGKTTYLKVLESFYKDYCQFPVVFFEAWKYQEDDHPLVSLVLEIRDQLEPIPKIKRSFTSLAKALLASSIVFSDVLLNLVIKKGVEDVKKALDLIEKEQLKIISNYRRNMDLLKKIINELRENYKSHTSTQIWKKYVSDWKINREKKLFVLIIDDLDRLIPKNAFKIIEALRFYFDIDDVLIIMGVNDEILNRYVSQYYQGNEKDNPFKRGENFLEKIFHWNYEISYSPLNDLHLRSLKKILTPDEINLLKTILNEIDFLSHRKWVKLINRIEKKVRFFGQNNLPLLVFTAIVKELFPRFELYSRPFPRVIKDIYDGVLREDQTVYEGVKIIVNDESHLHFPQENYFRVMQKIKDILREERRAGAI